MPVPLRPRKAGKPVIGNCSYVLGIIIVPAVAARVPYVAVGPETMTTRRERNVIREIVAGLVSDGMTLASRSPYDVLVGTCPPGWRVLLGPTKAAILTPCGLALASDVDTTTPPGWNAAIRAFGGKLVVFYAATDQLGLGDTPVLTQLEQCATAGKLMGTVVRVDWSLVNP